MRTPLLLMTVFLAASIAACNTCHTWQGTSGAPGRVVLQKVS